MPDLKKVSPTNPNDYRSMMINHRLDPLQAPHKAHRSVDDAVNISFYLIPQHLDPPISSHIRSLFVNFSSALNTVILSLLQDKLSQLNVSECAGGSQ